MCGCSFGVSLSFPVCTALRATYDGLCASECVSGVNMLTPLMFFCSYFVDLNDITRVMVLQDNFILSWSSCNYIKREPYSAGFVLLFLISGNVQPHPGLDSFTYYKTLSDFKSRTGLGFNSALKSVSTRRYKYEYCLSETIKHVNNTLKFWETIHSFSFIIF